MAGRSHHGGLNRMEKNSGGDVTLLLLFISSSLPIRREIKLAAVSSTLTFNIGLCKAGNIYRIQHDNVTIHIHCHGTNQIPDKFKGRISVNESTGCVAISNITKSDAGNYKLKHTDTNGKKITLLETEVKVLEHVWIKELSRNHTNETISLTMVCAGEQTTLNWTMDGGDLRDTSWLSDDNRTLAVPHNITGTFTVIASNVASADCKNITLIRDLNGKDGFLGPIMYQNITKVIWGEGGGPPSNETLILQRNATNIGVITPSEVTKVPRRRDRRFILILIATILVVALFFGLWCSRVVSPATGNT